MQGKQKKRMIQKLWGWICMAINCFVVSLYLTDQHAEALGGGIFLAILTICYGVIKTHLDKLKGDTSLVSVTIEYICVYIITFLVGFKVASYIPSVSVLISLVIATIVEILIFFLITYQGNIRRFFLQCKHKKQKNEYVYHNSRSEINMSSCNGNCASCRRLIVL